jgi:hypothetical protein
VSKTIGTYVRVKFLQNSPFPDTVATLHINKLEAETSVPIQPNIGEDSAEADVRLLKSLFDSYSYHHVLLTNDMPTQLTSVPFPSEELPVEPSVSSASGFCHCGNNGTGKFVECEMEAKCKSVRFFHMSCVGYVESLNPKKQKPFRCQACQKADRKRDLPATRVNQFSEMQLNRKNFSRQRSPMYSLLFQTQLQSSTNHFRSQLSFPTSNGHASRSVMAPTHTSRPASNPQYRHSSQSIRQSPPPRPPPLPPCPKVPFTNSSLPPCPKVSMNPSK